MALTTVARVYADVNTTRPAAYWNYGELDITWGRQDCYQLTHKLGQGKYSEVFLATHTHNTRPCVVKILKPVRKKKIQRELSILQNLHGGPNIVVLHDIVRDPQTMIPSLIFEYVRGKTIREWLPVLSSYDKKYYLYQLLMALDYSHSMGIMHRDVKPGNTMVDHNNRQLKLLDWGLADYYHPGQDYHAAVGSRYYKAPELLVEYPYYDYSVDMWSFGCLVAAFALGPDPFFVGEDNTDQMAQIVEVLGWARCKQYLDKYQITIDEAYQKRLAGRSGKPWERFVTGSNYETATVETIDLLERVMKYDHQERLTAAEAMWHPFFREVREQEGYRLGCPSS